MYSGSTRPRKPKIGNLSIENHISGNNFSLTDQGDKVQELNIRQGAPFLSGERHKPTKTHLISIHRVYPSQPYTHHFQNEDLVHNTTALGYLIPCYQGVQR
jgi:hypothetical protein